MPIQLNGQTEASTSTGEAGGSSRASRLPNRAGRLSCAPDRPGAKYFDTLLWRILSQHQLADAAGFLLGLTSCDRHAGVTTVAINLAIRAADQTPGPVLLADCNIYHPALHTVMQVKSRPGLMDVLNGRATLEDCVQATSVTGLQFLPIGAQGRSLGANITSDHVEALVAHLREQYSLVVCDLPDVGRLGPLISFAKTLNAASLVVRSERTTRRAASDAVRSLVADGVDLAGAVVTDRRSVLPSWLERLL